MICLIGGAPAVMTADEHGGDKPYLALGDSVPFGFMPLPGLEAVNASNFVGYPEYLGNALRLTTINGTCPGETSASVVDSFAHDNGCEEFRARFPLHVAYEGTQGDFAIEFVRANRQTRLVTIQVGANDLFQLRDRCFDLPDCIRWNLPVTLTLLEQNILTTIAGLRAAGYRRSIVIVNYYPLELADTPTTRLTLALNAALSDAADRGDAIIADTFSAFSRAISMSAAAKGTACGAGLLKANSLVPLTCDVHPSQSGQRLIADTIARVVGKAEDH
jgi:lysophospholipase L1-like esterase